MARKKKAPPPKTQRRRYICGTCNRHHSAYTKIGVEHRKFNRNREGAK